ncbi:FAD-dependent pyridine nucleotide-disulfide oxidoreductase [Halorubrum coriense DSM 10284]|uniref:FAD-dependent pyridine nucleotide-disulfide oxidoreductase n=2 Tax=Halorubrum coriense TaxID=64713 RepID=M0E8I9_9EURY|nr:FAD-dependent pyridine nucleotide-disulfide oxidoreductase [Halorubrum coriense DSM 10284]
MSTATRLRRLDETAEIVVLERGENISYASCGLPYHLSGTVSEDDLTVMGSEQLAAAFDLDIRTGVAATNVDPDTQTVSVTAADGEPAAIAYDDLVIATGAKPLVPPMFDLSELEHCHTLRTVSDATTIRERMTGDERALVIGGGYIGLEVAENLSEAGNDVVVAELLEQVMPNTLGPEMAARVESRLRDRGVDLRLGTGVDSLTEPGDGTVVATTDDSRETFDLVVVATGVTPRTELAESASVELHDSGAVAVDDRMRTSTPSIHAVGDVAAPPAARTGGNAWVPLGGPANRMGRVAANDIAGLDDRLDPVLDTSIAKVFDLDVGTVGDTVAALDEEGQAYEAVYTSQPDHAEYYPGASEIDFKLLFDPDDGTILGAQAIGESGVDKRIDVLATAIAHRDTVFDIRDYDLAYAPPYSAAKDPVNVLGMIGANVVEDIANVVHLDEFLERKDEATVIDTRPPEMREAQGRIDGDENVPLGEIREWAADVNPDGEVFTYCKIGKSSYMATRVLAEYGITARSLTGGYYRYEYASTDDDKRVESVPAE